MQAIALGLFSSVEEARGLCAKKHRDPLGRKGSASVQVRSLLTFHASLPLLPHPSPLFWEKWRSPLKAIVSSLLFLSLPLSYL